MNSIAGPEGMPTACKTVFGWAIRGPYSPDCRTQVRAATQVVISTDCKSPDELLSRFWEVEEPPMEETAFTPEEEYVQELYATNHVSLPDTGHMR